MGAGGCRGIVPVLLAPALSVTLQVKRTPSLGSAGYTILQSGMSMSLVSAHLASVGQACLFWTVFYAKKISGIIQGSS